MRLKCLSRLFALLFLFSCSSCNVIFKNYINNKYPPVSSLEKSAASTQSELQALQSIPKVGIGMQVNSGLLDTLIKTFFLTKLLQNSSLGIKGVGNVEFISPPVFSLGRQEIIVNTTLRLSDIQNKYLKEVEFDLNGRVSPSVSGDSILLAPSFGQIHIDHLKLRKWIILSGLAKRVVNSLMKSYMDNVNGALKDFALQVRYPAIPEEPLSKLLGTDDNLKVITDDTFRLRPRKLNPVILVDTGHIGILADVVVNNNSPSPVPASSPIRQPFSSLETASITPEQFDKLFHSFDSLFVRNWNLYLDTLVIKNPLQGQVCLAYNTLSDMMNELWAKSDFKLSYKLNYGVDFPWEHIKLAEISQPDCGAIPFEFHPIDCSTVLSDCGSCHWYDVICHARWLACQGANTVKYAACQTANAVKLAEASAEWVAQKGLCYTEVAAIFIVNNLVLSVGYLKGSAGVDGNVTGQLLHAIPGGIESLGLTANIQATGKANATLIFVPTGLVGFIACSLPAVVSVSNQDVGVNTPSFTINAITEKINQADKCILRVHTGNLSIPIQLGQPLISIILRQPGLVLTCSVGTFFGTLVASALDLTHNQHFKNYLDALFRGNYNWAFHKDLDVPLPAIPITSGATKLMLTPTWGKNSIIYEKN